MGFARRTMPSVNGKASNHRYTTDFTVHAQMLAQCRRASVRTRWKCARRSDASSSLLDWRRRRLERSVKRPSNDWSASLPAPACGRKNVVTRKGVGTIQGGIVIHAQHSATLPREQMIIS